MTENFKKNIKLVFAFILFTLTPINIISYYHLWKEEKKINKLEYSIKDTVIKYEKVFPNLDSVLFITKDKSELKSEASFTSTTKAYLKVNSIFYILAKGKEMDKLNAKSKENYWYEISDNKGLSGWIFGDYTSKELNINK